MIRFVRGWVGAGVVFAGAVVAGDARAQYGYAPTPPPQVCGPGYSGGAGYGYGGGSGYGYGYGGPAGYGYGSGYGYDGRRPCPPIPAERRGYWEGVRYWETGIAPQRPLSPAEAYGFRAGERGAAATPWQLDPIRQRGYREGLRFGETGIAPYRPLSPAEAQGFEAGERRAAYGGGRWPR